jgi:hypothetical protein
MSNLTRNKKSMEPHHEMNIFLTRSVVRMDWTPVKAPYGRTSVEHMSTAFRQELGYERCNEGRNCISDQRKKALRKQQTGMVNAQRASRESSHSLCVSSVLRLTLVCSPNGPKSQDTGGEDAAAARPSEPVPSPPSVGIYAIPSLKQWHQ